MIDTRAPDPFSLAAWCSNTVPDDPDKRAWWLCSLIAAAFGRAVIDEVAVQLATVRPLADA